MVVVEVRGLRRGTYRITADSVGAAWDEAVRREGGDGSLWAIREFTLVEGEYDEATLVWE